MNIRNGLIFLAISLGGGLLIGSFSTPDGWYEGLVKPAFNPPPWLFAPIWTVLYVLIAIAGARVFSADLTRPFRLWSTQMVLNFAWSPTFFIAHRIDIALGIILALLVVILAFIVSAWHRDRLAAALFIPYAAWVGFASVLNFALLRLNG